MESNRKRRGGFMKGKLMPFYRSPKPTTTTTTNVNQYSSKVIKPSQSSTSASASYNVVHHHHHHHHRHQDYIIAPPNQKVSFIVPTTAVAENNRAEKLLSQLDKLYGINYVDESVDIKTASYISSVQERFKLERSTSERVKFDDKK